MIRVAAVADIHFGPGKEAEIAERFAGVAEVADVLLIPGDLTDHGSEGEADSLGRLLGEIGLPIAAVMGNHDMDARDPAAFSAALRRYNVLVLDGDVARLEISGQSLGIAGIRGARGGFGKNMLGDTAEPDSEAWIKRAKAEAQKLDRALAHLNTDFRIAMLHYAPIPGTIEGEHPETYPFYGSGRLLDPIEKHQPDLVVHGHSHKGTPRGETPSGIPVYNVAAPIIGKPFVILELGE